MIIQTETYPGVGYQQQSYMVLQDGYYQPNKPYEHGSAGMPTAVPPQYNTTTQQYYSHQYPMPNGGGHVYAQHQPQPGYHGHSSNGQSQMLPYGSQYAGGDPKHGYGAQAPMGAYRMETYEYSTTYPNPRGVRTYEYSTTYPNPCGVRTYEYSTTYPNPCGVRNDYQKAQWIVKGV